MLIKSGLALRAGTRQALGIYAVFVWEQQERLFLPGTHAASGGRRGVRSTKITRSRVLKGDEPAPGAFARYLDANPRLLQAGEGQGVIVLSRHPHTRDYPEPPAWAIGMAVARAQGLWVAVDRAVVTAELDSPLRPGDVLDCDLV